MLKRITASISIINIPHDTVAAIWLAAIECIKALQLLVLCQLCRKQA
jgi:hypothetical protein